MCKFFVRLRMGSTLFRKAAHGTARLGHAPIFSVSLNIPRRPSAVTTACLRSPSEPTPQHTSPPSIRHCSQSPQGPRAHLHKSLATISPAQQKHSLLNSQRRGPTSSRPRPRSLRTSRTQRTAPMSAGSAKSATVREGSMGACLRAAVFSARVRGV